MENHFVSLVVILLLATACATTTIQPKVDLESYTRGELKEYLKEPRTTKDIVELFGMPNNSIFPVKSVPELSKQPTNATYWLKYKKDDGTKINFKSKGHYISGVQWGKEYINGNTSSVLKLRYSFRQFIDEQPKVPKLADIPILVGNNTYLVDSTEGAGKLKKTGDKPKRYIIAGSRRQRKALFDYHLGDKKFSSYEELKKYLLAMPKGTHVSYQGQCCKFYDNEPFRSNEQWTDFTEFCKQNGIILVYYRAG